MTPKAAPVNTYDTNISTSVSLCDALRCRPARFASRRRLRASSRWAFLDDCCDGFFDACVEFASFSFGFVTFTLTPEMSAYKFRLLRSVIMHSRGHTAQGCFN